MARPPGLITRPRKAAPEPLHIDRVRVKSSPLLGQPGVGRPAAPGAAKGASVVNGNPSGSPAARLSRSRPYRRSALLAVGTALPFGASFVRRAIRFANSAQQPEGGAQQ